MKSMTRVENSISAIDTARSHSTVPITPETRACLIMETLSDRVIIVAPRRKLVMIVSLKLAASRSTLGCSNGLWRRVRLPI